MDHGSPLLLVMDHVRPCEHRDDWHVTGHAIAGATLGVLLAADVIFWGIWAGFSMLLDDGPQVDTLSFVVLLFFTLLSATSKRTYLSEVSSFSVTSIIVTVPPLPLYRQ